MIHITSETDRCGSQPIFIYSEVRPKVLEVLADPTLIIDLHGCVDEQSCRSFIRWKIANHFDLATQAFGFAPLGNQLLAHLLATDNEAPPTSK